MKKFNQVVIFGTGLMGGSLGLALKRKQLANQIIGFSRHKTNAAWALKIGAIDRIGYSLEVTRDADLIILATPVEAIIKIMHKISKKIKKDCIIIDLGSTKENIVFALSKLTPNFLGCHPLAGSEKNGIKNAKLELYNNSICILTPTAKTKKAVFTRIKLLWQKIGAKTISMPPKQHDLILSFTSHLPHLVAFSLISTIPNKFLSLSSGGLKDSTRIAASDESLWSQVFLSNRKNLISAVSSFQTKLAALKLALMKKDVQCLTRILLSAKEKRERLK